jgi:transcriptional regulator with XRE-family HTH domain
MPGYTVSIPKTPREKKNMMTLEEIAARLKDRRIDMVCEKTGLSRPTVHAVRSGQNKNPSLKTMKALSNYLQEHL